ncbi:Bardet-Biedl syndrome 2 protein homolog [Centruroides sculpturatus]|uniref:Bardet-Biedl syndrome 2 protein homolog n=1 Tax=Centruroides sculpturatus TaxID=218467 RepID=UPI000C6D082F|nr:Bardet-Biedl syndrome 2 protein homolog [Centruroides sculpturatus]
MLVPVFTVNVNHKILPHRVTIGLYDGINPCITAVTSSDKIFIHNPHAKARQLGGRQTTGSSSEISLLNINQTISSVAAGRLKPDAADILIVGTPTNVLAYDVENNTDIFYKDVADGANCITIGDLGNRHKPLALIGGNCSIQGFDHEGNDSFWTVTGDNVSSMSLCDFNQDGLNELLVGSEDFDIRVFKDDEIISEMTETEAVTGLCPILGDYFGYALANGTVGVYKGTERSWRIKSKNQAICIFNFDIDGDGVPELITGWSNGKIDARNVQSGEVVFKDNFSHCIAGIVKGDYLKNGQEELIFCSVDGEVRGYGASTTEMRHHILDASFEQETIKELSQRKQTLLLELRNYEENSRIGSSGGTRTLNKPSHENDNYGVIPANTQLKTALSINSGSENKAPHVDISLQTSNDTIIKSVLIFAEGIFDGESHVVHPKENQLSSIVHIPLFPPKDIPIDLHIKALVGYKTSVHYHVFELTRQLPRFSMYSLCTEPIKEEPKSYVNFIINDRIQRMVTWINQNFLLSNEYEVKGDVKISFLSLRTSQLLVIKMDNSGDVTVMTDDMEMAGDVIQSMVQYFNIDDLQVTAEFPQQIEILNNLLSKVEELQSVRQRLSADMADNSGAIRSFVIHAEDARLMGNYKAMRKWYQELHALNHELISNYKIRSNNHEELLNCLKQINQIIQRAGHLRAGKPKTQVIGKCRNAIKNNNLNSLIKIIQTGEA